MSKKIAIAGAGGEAYRYLPKTKWTRCHFT